MSCRFALVVSCLLAACAAPSQTSRTGSWRSASGPPAAQLIDGLDVHHRAIATSVPEAQVWFDQGVLLCVGFNHEEAIASFTRAAELDPDCAMAWWGIAFAAGPNINSPGMDEARSRTAWDALRRAQEALAAQELQRAAQSEVVTQEGVVQPDAAPADIERALIDALARRYAWPPPPDRVALDRAFADAMRDLWHDHPQDADVGALFAEALMDCRPWDLWSADGELRPETHEVLGTLAAVLALEPDHPQALHLTIHAYEASPHPERALPAADLLRTRVPSAGHLLHMPSHIDIRVGHYADAVAANQRAIAADDAYVAQTGRHGRYDTYRAHNRHFLVYAAMFEGRSELALSTARGLLVDLPADLVARSPDRLEGFLTVPDHVLVRFGKWEEILAQPPVPPGRPVSAAVRRYARGLAYASLGRVEAAEVERRLFLEALRAVPPTSWVGKNPSHVVLDIARPLLEGEILFRRGDHDAAFAQLREAVARDDALRYSEPWSWMQPPRHALGALLLEHGDVADAEDVYRADLLRHPDNGWALRGLAECLQRRGAGEPDAAARAPVLAEAARVQAALAVAWAHADVVPPGSCYCRRG